MTVQMLDATISQMRLNGKRAVISGGGSGIGRATAIIFAREGASVAIVGRRKDRLDITASMVRAQGGRCHIIQGDVSLSADVKRVAKESVKALGGVDILFNNAGVHRFGSVEDTEEDLWDNITNINLKGTYLMSQHLIGVMKKNGGVIINNSSTLGLKPVPNTAAYSAAKAGVISLTKSMALELAKDKIRVNCICPGVVDTPIHSEQSPEFMEEMAAYHPLGRIGTPEDVAYAALYLASDEANWITGVIMPVDGGISCT
ncbi:MAG: SDR family oxidoreductase [Proteobacteria bacterium]|nr:SDR family oxidoreductase [Pseudomonadota bacterium]